MDPKTSRNFVVGAVILVLLALVIGLAEGEGEAMSAERALAFFGTRFGLLAIAAILGFGFLIVLFAGKKKDK
jgi:hypothetical protein